MVLSTIGNESVSGDCAAVVGADFSKQSLGIRGVLDAPLRAVCECVMCPVDHAGLRWFGALTPLPRTPTRRRSAEIAETADWVRSLLPDAVIALFNSSVQRTYLSAILDELRVHDPLCVLCMDSAPLAAAASLDVPRVTLDVELRETLENARLHLSLLGRIKHLVRLGLPCLSERTANAAVGAGTSPTNTAAHRIATAATQVRRTVVLGEWGTLSVLIPPLCSIGMADALRGSGTR